jgi:hypothetical protein
MITLDKFKNSSWTLEPMFVQDKEPSLLSVVEDKISNKQSIKDLLTLLIFFVGIPMGLYIGLSSMIDVEDISKELTILGNEFKNTDLNETISTIGNDLPLLNSFGSEKFEMKTTYNNLFKENVFLSISESSQSRCGLIINDLITSPLFNYDTHITFNGVSIKDRNQLKNLKDNDFKLCNKDKNVLTIDKDFK